MSENDKDSLDGYQESPEKAAIDFDVKVGAETVVDSYVALEKICSEKGISLSDLNIELQREMLIQTCQNVRDRRLTRKVDERRKAYLEAKKEYWQSKASGKQGTKGKTRRHATEKMKKLLMDRGYTSEEVDRMSFEEAGNEIERIKREEGW